MNLFKCNDGMLINPKLVTHCYYIQEMEKYIVRFRFTSEWCDIELNTKNQAIRLMIDFEKHCRTEKL